MSELLPLEFDASRRTLVVLEGHRSLVGREVDRAVSRAAVSTCVGRLAGSTGRFVFLESRR